MQKERDLLKTLIGFPERGTEDIKKQYDEDMQTYGNEKNPKATSGPTSRSSTPRPSTTTACSRA